MTRPDHRTVIDELGMKKSMPAAKEHFEWRVNHRLDEAPVVFLGLGPEPDKVPEWFDLPDDEVYYFLESQDVIDQIEDWEHLLPDNFERISPDEFTRDSSANAHVVRYLPIQRTFPSFYGPLTARLTLGSDQLHPSPQTVWIPTSDDDLLVKELSIAFKSRGYDVYFIDHEALGKHPGNALPEMLTNHGVPDLFFSVNFKGLDHFGLGAAILHEAGTKVAAWLVDNPFNVLPSVKAEYWKNINLFVTDHTFIGPLIKTGARWVNHLPLAASPSLFAEGATLPEHGHGLEDSLVFVGRSRFPKQEQFFAACTIPDELVETVMADTTNTRFDYHWWRDQLSIAPLWPGNQVRNIGAGAEFAGVRWKRRCLESAGPLTIFGDDGWNDLSDADVRPFVDYYAHLPAVYRTAAATLNVTGMQLPAGLTQRHFDVWCAGGFLLTDANPGLGIFPDDLTTPITFATPDEIPGLFGQFRQKSDDKQALREAWRQLILAEHTYAHRVDTIVSTLGL